jgi:4,5-DOPA dioxygenase extradiol
LIQIERIGTSAKLAVPTPDHYWPLLYALGAGSADDDVTFPVDEAIEMGSISMRAIKIG